MNDQNRNGTNNNTSGGLGGLVAILIGIVLGVALDLGDRGVEGGVQISQPDIVSVDEHPMALAEALARSSTPVSAGFRRSLLEAGYFVDEVDKMAEVELPNGNSIRMPIRQVNIHYLGMSAYQ